MSKTKLRVPLFLVVLMLLALSACKEEVRIFGGPGTKGTPQSVTITYNSGNNTCTQNPRIFPMHTGDTLQVSSNTGDPVTVKFPQPDNSVYNGILPGSPFLIAAPDSWQWAVSSGTPSNSAAVTTRETPSNGNLFYFYYSEILINGNPCIMNDPQGMGISVQR